MTTFFYKTGGKVSRSLLDYEGNTIEQFNTSFTLDDWWEEQYQTQRIEEVTYGTVGDAAPYGIGSRIKGSGIGNDTQIATGGFFIVGENDISLGRFTNAFEGRSYNYYPCMVDYYTELNYGSITSNATTLENHGDVSHGVVTNVEYGHIWIVATQYSFLPALKVIGKTSWKATEAFVGDGRLWSWGEQSSPAVYGYIVDGKVRGLAVLGTADVDYSPAPKGRGILPLHGTSGIGFSPLVRGTGSLRKFTGTAYSLTINPDEKQMLFSFNGVLGLRRTADYIGSGFLKNFSNTEGDKSFAYTGSGSISILSRKPESNLSDEKHTESYNPSAIVEWGNEDWGVIGGCTNVETISTSSDVTGVSTGCIVKIDQGVTARVDTSYQIAANNNAASYFINYGSIAETHTQYEVWGNVLDNSNLMPFGGIKIDPYRKGSAYKFNPNWVGRGTIRVFGDAKLPLFASITTVGYISKIGGAAKTNFSLLQPAEGLFKIHSFTNTPRSRIHIGSGSLRKIGGSATSLTINPDEKQMLFSFTGEHQVRFGYGTFEGHGNIKNLAGGIETGTFDYVGSGSIITWNKLEEAITSSYNCSSIIPWIDLDYGLILDRNNTTCISDSGDKTTDITAASGCVKVDSGTVLSIAPNNTYTIPSQQTVASITEDYGTVTRIAAATRDYDWILGTTTHGMPSCIHGELDISGSAGIQFVPNWIGDGQIKITGVAKLPLFASHTTEGMFGHLRGEAITNFSLLGQGDGLFKIVSNTLTNLGRKEIGEGILSTLSGSANSATWNPEETQMLFSFTGGYSSLKFSHGTFIGDGILFNFAGGEERGTYSYTGSGSILTFNKLEEAVTSSYNCSSIVEFGVFDYGRLVDLSNASCIHDSGDKTSDVTAASGCIKVAPNTILSVAPSNTYTIPSQITVPSTYADYGSITRIAEATPDYGWILGTTTHGMPSCIYGELDISGSASTQHVQRFIGGTRGYINVYGVARLPLFASHTTLGMFGHLRGEAITSLSIDSAADGLYHIGGDSLTSLTREEIGDGIFSTFSGAADSTTYNPDEKQMLFSFTGGYSDLKFTYGAFEGDGILWSFAGGAERGTYSYTGSGSILTFNKLEEAVTHWYNCSSVIEWQDLDYGLLVSAAQAPCVLDSGDKTTDVTAPSGCIKVAPNTILSVAPNNTYTVPSHLTTATEFEYYDSVAKIAEGTKDHGWILGTVAHGMPSCIYGTFAISGAADCDFSSSDETKGLFKVLGNSKTNFSLGHIGSGDLFTFSGASETLSAAIEGGGLFKITSLTDTPRARVCEGTGTLRKISGTATSLTVNPDEKQMLFSFTGGVISEKHTEAYVGSGFLRNLATVETRATFDWNATGVIKLRSNTSESQSDVYDMHLCHVPLRLDYGLLVSAAQATCISESGVISTNTTAPSGCVKIDPNTTLAVVTSNVYTVPSHLTVPTSSENYQSITDLHLGTRDYDHILGSLSSPACPFGSIEFYNEATCAEVQVYTFVASGESEWKVYGINISGDADVVTPPKWNSPGDPPVKLRSFTKPNFSLLHPGSGSMFSYSGTAESVRYSPDEEQLLFKIVPGPLSRWDTYDWQPSWVTRGFIKGAIGEAKTHYVPDVVGEGTIWNYSGTAESITVNPEEKQLLFSFTGEASESYTRSKEGTGQTRVLGNVLPYFVPNYPGYGVIPVTGNAGIHYVPHVIGEGIIWNYSGTAESITVNPDEKQMLFSFIGERLSEVKSVAETGFGTAILSGEVFTTRALSPEIFGRIPVLGDGHTTRTRLYIGSGFLRKLGGSAESITVNPDEKQMLFSFLGEGTESKSVVTSGDGRLFGFGGAAITTRAAYETTGLYRVNGDAFVTASLLHVGSGTLRKIGGSAESLTVNPDERQLLFSFTGNSDEKHTEVHVGSGSATLGAEATNVRYIPHITGSGTTNISGIVKSHYVPHVIGTGTLRKISGAAESITINPDEKQMLFSFTGELAERILVREISKGGTIDLAGTSGDPLLTFAEQPFVQTKVSGQVKFTVHRSIFGTGSLFAFAGAAESTTTVPPTEQVLYTFAGSSTNKLTRVYVGSGSLKKLSGAAESITVNPDEQQMLFSFTGAGTQSKTAREIGTGTLSTTGEAGVLITRAFAGEGTILVSGNAHTTRARDYVGFGFIPTFSGAAESLTFNPDEKQMLFSFHGTRIAEVRTVTELSKGGTLVVGSTSGDPILTFAEQPYVNIDVTGDSYDIRTRAYQGSGRLSGLNNVDQAFARAPYIGSGTARISGEGFVQVVLFTPPSVQVWII